MNGIALITSETQSGFYPTPKELADKLLENIRWYEIQSVLEPSAGKGDLAQAARAAFKACEWRNHDLCDIDCVEIDPNLRAILKEPGFRVVHDDFLTYQTQKRYDLIIMNPPFADGDRHLLKALSLLKYGGQIRCILNAETIRNPYSNTRKMLMRELTELNADISYIENAFTDAERKTGVEIAIVSAKDKRQRETNSFIHEQLRPAHRFVEASETGDYTALAKADPIDAIVDKYNYELECGLKMIEEFRALNPRMLSISFNGNDPRTNDYVRAMRKVYWQMLFENEKIVGRLPGKLREKLRNMVDELADYEFSAYNIYELMIHMNGQMTQSISDTIMKLFDDWTRKYHWDENAQNRHYFDGWRTNDAFAVNSKIIIPLYAFSQWKWDRDCFESYRVREHIEDIQKVFDFLDGGRTENVDVPAILKEIEKTGNARNVQFKYFKATFYKKGTCHITFTNPDVLAKFNLFAAQNKHWLPPSFGKKHYKQMDEEERAVVDSFTGGEKTYESMMDKADYYFFASGEQPFLLVSGKEEP